ncbi:unnamed protein product [Symbiodinium natans]|uniref:Uncharacterized protein n=1 Tax=Symbiodinium natans TaxID=878477 RepID=A0A812IIV2_9DINO|nr:unnamed protein product [Symbiodinium natans]
MPEVAQMDISICWSGRVERSHEVEDAADSLHRPLALVGPCPFSRKRSHSLTAFAGVAEVAGTRLQHVCVSLALVRESEQSDRPERACLGRAPHVALWICRAVRWLLAIRPFRSSIRVELVESACPKAILSVLSASALCNHKASARHA